MSHTQISLREFIDFSQTVEDNWTHSIADKHLLEDHWHPNKLDLQSDSIVISSQGLISTAFILQVWLFESHSHLSFKVLFDFSQTVEDNWSHSVADKHLLEDHWHPNKLDLQSDSIVISSQGLISTAFILQVWLFESHSHLSFKVLFDFSQTVEDNWSHSVADKHLLEDHWHPIKLCLHSFSNSNIWQSEIIIFSKFIFIISFPFFKVIWIISSIPET